MLAIGSPQRQCIRDSLRASASRLLPETALQANKPKRGSVAQNQRDGPTGKDRLPSARRQQFPSKNFTLERAVAFSTLII
jgi:hypothetical protein